MLSNTGDDYVRKIWGFTYIYIYIYIYCTQRTQKQLLLPLHRPAPPPEYKWEKHNLWYSFLLIQVRSSVTWLWLICKFQQNTWQVHWCNVGNVCHIECDISRAVAITNKLQTLQQFKVDKCEDSDRIHTFDPLSGKILSKVEGMKRTLINL